MGGGRQLLLALAPHLEVEPERLASDAPDVGADFEQVVEPRGAAEVAFEVGARQPDVQFVEHHAVGEAGGAEQLRLGELEEAYVSTVEDYPRGVNVAPADALLDAKLPRFAQAEQFLKSAGRLKTPRARG